jgi:hypothetical protein
MLPAIPLGSRLDDGDVPKILGQALEDQFCHGRDAPASRIAERDHRLELGRAP